MTNVAEGAQESAATDAPVENEAQTPEGQEAEATENTQDTSETNEVVEEVETAEAKAERLEKELEDKQKYVNRRVAAYKDAQEKLARQTQELEALKASQAPEPVAEPKIEDFETYDEYMEAVKKHTAEIAKQEAVKEFQSKQVQEQQQQIAQERNAIVTKQEAEYLADNPDYHYAKTEFEQYIRTAQVDPTVERAIVEQAFEGNVPQLIDYFGGNNGENIDKLAEISKLPPTRAAVEVYKIQQSLKAPEKPEVKPAPAPVKKPKGGGAPKKDINSMSGDEVLKKLGFKD